MNKTACTDDYLDLNESKKIKIDSELNEQVEIEEENNEIILLNNKIANSYGIIQRINKDFTRFSGLIKQSAADFIVNEIDLEENVVRLTNFDLPIIEKETITKTTNNLNLEVERALGNDIFQKLIQFLDADTASMSFKLEAPKEKSDRKLIHEFIKTEYKKFNSNTIQEETKQMIEISHQKSNRNVSARDCFKNNSRTTNELGDNKVLTCSMYKENIDTIQAVSLICRNLRINTKRIGYAGTKDKKAKTTQQLSFFKIEPSQVLRLNKNFHNIKLGNFKLRPGDGLRLGDLSGNRFKLVIREIDEQNNQIIQNGIESLKTNGFINYFGLQRFGTCNEAPTHIIGKYLILNNVKDAIELILKPRESGFEKEEVKIARHTWNTKRDAKQALACIEKINCVEKFLLEGLSKCNSNDYLGAFQFLPRNMRLMYLHAYQSYIWNKIVTKRFELFGFQPVIGDLVRKLNNKDEIITLVAENINDFTIDQVVLPLPGHSVKYPDNQIRKSYEELLAIDGIEIDGLKNKIKEFSLSGDYRNILTKPNDLQYEIIDYTDKNKDLTKSDWDLINQKEVDSQVEQEIKPKTGSIYKAVVIEYNLPSSSYATMALRELLKDS